MLNKFITYGGALGCVLILLFGHDLVSYVTTASTLASTAVRSKIPIDFEIDRAKQMIEDLGPSIRENMVVIAREEIDVEQLREQIAELVEAQASQRASLTDLQDSLVSGGQQFVRGATRFTAAEYTAFAESKFERYRTNNQTLQSLRQTLAARQKGLGAARKQLATLISAKDQLVAEIASLEARQKMNEVARSAHELSGQSLLDESQLTRTRQLVREIETRVRVEERLSATKLHFMDEVMLVVDPAETAEGPSDVAEKIERYLANEDRVEPMPVGSLAEVTSDRFSKAVALEGKDVAN